MGRALKGPLALAAGLLVFWALLVVGEVSFPQAPKWCKILAQIVFAGSFFLSFPVFFVLASVGFGRRTERAGLVATVLTVVLWPIFLFLAILMMVNLKSALGGTL